MLTAVDGRARVNHRKPAVERRSKYSRAIRVVQRVIDERDPGMDIEVLTQLFIFLLVLKTGKL